MKKITAICLVMIMTVMTYTMFGTTAYAADINSTAGVVTTSSGNLNVRNSASTSASIITSLPRNSNVTLISKNGSWWYVEYGDGRYGYTHGDYIKQVSGSKAAAVQTSSGNLNVRQGAGTNYNILTTLPKGKNVVVLSEANGWSKILYHGTRVGYVSSQYLSGSNSSAYPAVKLSLQDFKQTDSRWADVKLGSSGKTIRQIGCTTTALAMTESYRTGTTIYPDQMSKKLSYSSSGDLYWPSNYVQTTNSSQYLNTVYQQLSAGKPVLVGAKSNTGKQHWVVVTGFQGSASLNLAQFTVNDPGSNTIKNLQQFFNSYQNFYKLVYYK